MPLRASGTRRPCTANQLWTHIIDLRPSDHITLHGRPAAATSACQWRRSPIQPQLSQTDRGRANSGQKQEQKYISDPGKFQGVSRAIARSNCGHHARGLRWVLRSGFADAGWHDDFLREHSAQAGASVSSHRLFSGAPPPTLRFHGPVGVGGAWIPARNGSSSCNKSRPSPVMNAEPVMLGIT